MLQLTRHSLRLLGTFVAGIGLVASFGAPASGATIAPTVTLMLETGGVQSSVDIPVTVDSTTGIATVEGWSMTTAQWSITLNAELDPDPSIIYAASVIDFGAPTTFGFIFIQGIVPTAAPGLVDHTHSSSTTDNGAPLGTSVTAFPPAGIPVDGNGGAEIAIYTLSQNGGTTYLNAGLDLSPSFVGANPSGIQGPFNEGPIAGPAGAGTYDLMRVDVSFTMTGASDAYTFNGTATVIPEPTTIGLVSLGLAGLALAGRRRLA